MADRIPLIVNSNAKQIQELPTTDALLIHSGAGKGLEFTNNPGGGTGDIASITYEAVSGEQTNLKIAVTNDGAPSAGPDNIELSTPNGASINITSNTTSTSSTSGALVVTGGVGISKKLFVGDTTQSSSTTTGALVVAGGVGISKKLFVGNDTKIEGTTQSTSKDTGALIVEGGVGIEKKLFVGDDLTIGEGQLNLTGTSAAGDSDINLSGGSDGLAVVTNTSNSGKISFVTKNSGGTNSTIQLEHQKVNFSGPDISGTAVTFEPKGAAPIIGVRAYGFITGQTVSDTYTANINGVNIASYERVDAGGPPTSGGGTYKINFTHAMPHNNYVVFVTPVFIDPGGTFETQINGSNTYIRTTKTTTQCHVVTLESEGNFDAKDFSFHIAVVC